MNSTFGDSLELGQRLRYSNVTVCWEREQHVRRPVGRSVPGTLGTAQIPCGEEQVGGPEIMSEQ